jgi:hypothetical protein
MSMFIQMRPIYPSPCLKLTKAAQEGFSAEKELACIKLAIKGQNCLVASKICGYVAN